LLNSKPCRRGMKDIRWIPIALSFLLATGGTALAWGQEGHAAIAALASELISPKTRTKIQDLLATGGDKDLVSVASWADAVLIAAHDEGPLHGNEEAMAFNRKFPKSGMWHFVNLPLGATSYQQVTRFDAPDNIVHAIARCIEVLEAPSPRPEDFTKLQALRLLVHFVGDIHQPLHCGTGFYTFSESGSPQLDIEPESAFGKPNDRGGNLLYYGANAIQQLHALWDKVLVEELGDSFDYRVLTEFLRKFYLPKEIGRTPGDYHEWGKLWAIDSVRVAALAYRDISFGIAVFGADGSLSRIEISLPPGYHESNKKRAAFQLAKAGVHLAQLLDSIDWQ
jgi:S1/P1 Nuclease